MSQNLHGHTRVHVKLDQQRGARSSGGVHRHYRYALEGDANGAPHPKPSVYAKQFTGKYSHRMIEGGIGHNLPQEAPEAFAKAVIDVDAY